MANDQEFKTNDKWTKLMFGALIFFGITTLFLGILKLNKSINGQLLLEDTVDTGKSQNNNQPTVEQLMATDTDGDGLSDYQEIYTYGTSIYLADTDSDGYSDKEEVDGGYDPNCPKGMNCRSADQVDNLNNKDESNNDINQGVPTTPIMTGDKTDSGTLTQEQKDKLKNLSADEIRQLLLASGQIKEDELNQISDEQLMDVFKEMLGE